MSTDGSTQTSVQVLRKVGLLLDHMAEEPELSVSQLAELMGEPRSSVYRLLSNLRQLGLVEVGSQRSTYRLGLKLFRLGSRVVARFDERQAAIPVMERIHEETGETVFLCIRNGWEAVCIERLDGDRVQSLALRLGGSVPLHAGAATRTLLAYEPREFWLHYAEQRDLEVFTPNTPVTSKQLIAKLEDVLKRGYSVGDEDMTIGIAAIGAPIFGHEGKIRAALSISGVKPAILGGQVFERQRALVVQGAAEISRSLGYEASTGRKPAPSLTG